MVTREQLEERRRDLTEQRDRAMANVHAVSGAVQDVEYWLKILEEQEAAESEPKQATPGRLQFPLLYDPQTDEVPREGAEPS